MKKLLPLLCLLLPLGLFAQHKGAKQIVIQTDLPAAEGYKTVVNALLDAGYFLDQKDESLFTAKTQERELKANQYFFNVRAKDNQVIISGKFRTGTELSFGAVKATDNYTDIVNRGMNKSAFKLTFESMDLFAKSLNRPIEYL